MRAHVRPADFDPETVVNAWITKTATPPGSLAKFVAGYRNMQVYCDFAEDNDTRLDARMNLVFDYLLMAAAADFKAKLTGQFFHIGRPVIPLQHQWNAAIANWRKTRQS
jgi:hypothetical protein